MFLTFKYFCFNEAIKKFIVIIFVLIFWATFIILKILRAHFKIFEKI